MLSLIEGHNVQMGYDPEATNILVDHGNEIISNSPELYLPDNEIIVPDNMIFTDVSQYADELDKMLDAVDYSKYYDKVKPYVPTPMAVELMDISRRIYPEGMGYKSPPAHLEIYDAFAAPDQHSNIMAARGMAKSTTTKMLIFQMAVYGYVLIGHDGKYFDLRFMMYVSDSIDNGVKTMKLDLESTYMNSPWLQSMVDANFTINEWTFKSKLTGRESVVVGYGVKTGIRGARRLGTRPQYCLLDDLLSDEKASSQIELAKVNDILNSSVEFAIEPDGFIRLLGTPFDPRDPLYSRIANQLGHSVVIPICEKFPCTKEEFKGAWEDRYPYEWVAKKYNNFRKINKFTGFTRELMLRVGNDAEKSVDIGKDIDWISIAELDISQCNIYITTDLATGLRKDLDFLVILVWAVAPNKTRYIIDGWCEVQPIDKAITELFKFVKKYDPISVGIETSGQQGGFVRWMYERMEDTGVYFNIASNVKGVSGYSTSPDTVGLFPVSNKLQRFNNCVPLFKLKRIGMIKEFAKTPWMVELLEEISKATRNLLGALHDDAIDALSQIMAMDVIVPYANDVPPIKSTVKRDKNLYNNPFGQSMTAYLNTGDDEYFEVPVTRILEY